MAGADRTVSPAFSPRAAGTARSTAGTARRAEIFRPKALDHAALGTAPADVLRLSPAWTNKAYWVLIAAFVAAILYGTWARVFAYASGPAILWTSGALEVTANTASSLASVEVEPGDAVQAGQLLARFRADNEQAELRRLQEEFDWQLAKTLAEPQNQDARAALASLSARRDSAAAQIERTYVRAPRAGVIGDLRVRPGQSVTSGDVLFTLTDDRAACSVWALLPGHYRPELRAGAALRFDVDGYRYAHQTAVIRSIGSQVIGPREARRYLGNDISDAVPLDGSVVLVKAELPSCSFSIQAERLRFHHGMSGRAEVRLATEPLWEVLFPNLRSFLRRLHA